ncbi:MAG: hypothetical protein ACI4O0_01745 [Candidatus Limivicinus sp.]
MNKTLKRILNIALLLVLLIAMLLPLMRLTAQKDNTVRFDSFFDHAGDYNVLFFGTSHVRDGVLPLELWESYGISAYNCASSGASLPTTYWAMRNALEQAQPELIVLDCCRIRYPEKRNDMASLHDMMDPYPLTLTKVAAAMDLCDSEEMRGELYELIFPFSVYHSRWEQLTAEDFSPQSNAANGATPKVNVAVPNDFSPSARKTALDPALPGVVYLEKFIEECQSRGIQLLLTYLPYAAPPEDVEEANAVADLAEKYGLHYINFLAEDLIDLDTDLFDSFSHLNPSGAQKVTAYLGEFISRHYTVSDLRGDSAYAWMDEALSTYRGYMRSLLGEERYLAGYLALLRDASYAPVIHIPAGSSLYASPLFLKLIENIPLAEKPTLLRQAAETGAAYLLVVDSAAGEIHEFVGEMPKELNCSLGRLSFENGRLCLDGTEYAPVAPDSTDTALDCFVFDSASGLHLDFDRGFTLGDEGFVVAY